MTPTYELVTFDYGRGDAERLLERLADYTVAIERSVYGEIPTMRITLRSGFDGLRNTVAHGMACSAGFVCHVE
jgi:hypothetical protein